MYDYNIFYPKTPYIYSYLIIKNIIPHIKKIFYYGDVELFLCDIIKIQDINHEIRL